MTANTDAIVAFLDLINNNGNANYQVPSYIVNQCFSADAGGPPPTSPLVAITEHGLPLGPAFYGRQKIRKFFQRLFQAFPGVAFTPLNVANPNFLTSGDGGTIALQTTVTGNHQDWWFPPADPDGYHSLPLSAIEPNGGAITIPACPVFTFTAGSKIQQLAIYMDRYHFVRELAPALSLSFSVDARQVMRASKILTEANHAHRTKQHGG